jgi:protein-disulfide isomerase
LVYRDFPLTNIHPMAVPSALAAECAGEQGKFFEYHDKMFLEQNKLEPTEGRFSTVSYTQADLVAWAGQIGLNTGSLQNCLTSQKYLDEVNQDMEDGSAFGVTGTPGFFVNGRYINGAQPFSVFKQIIEEELNK